MNLSTRHRYILMATVAYAALALAWIFLSDWLLLLFLDIESVVWLSMVKGVFFVLISGGVFYFVLQAVPAAGDVPEKMPANALPSGQTARVSPRWLPYVYAVVLVTAMLLVRINLPVAFGDRPLLILFMLPIIVSALLGGFGPGMTATFMAGAAALYNIPPESGFTITASRDLFHWSLLIVNGLTVSLISEIMHRSRHREQMRLQQLDAATEELRQSEDRYRTLFENSLDAVLLTIPDGIILSANRAACRMFGRTEEEIRALGRAALVDSSDPRLAVLLEERALTGKAFGELTFFRKDGSRFPAEVSSVVFKDTAGNPRTSMIIRDVTARREAEESLRESEARYRQLFKANPLPMWLYDLETLAFLAVNNAAVAHYGYSREEFLAMTIKEIRPEEDVPELLVSLPHGREGLNAAGVWCHRKKDGTLIDVEISTHTLLFDGRRAKMVLAQDVTARKRAEAVLREKEVQYRNLADAGQALIWTSDTDKLCTYFNRRWLEFTGRTLEQELGNGWAEGVHPDDFDRCLGVYTTAFDRREPFDVEYRLRHADGEYRWIRDMGTPNYDSAGEFVGYIGHCFDITEQKRAENERQQLIGELEKRNTELERFTYTVSHDLKSPLVTILGFTGQLTQDLADDEPANVKADLDFIRNAANQMRELLDSLLQLSRAGRTIGEPQPVDLPVLVQQTIEQVGDRLAHARLRVEFPAELPVIMGDPIRLREVFQNLLENAAKFTADQPDPCIEIGCVIGKDELLCHVRDNGIGIPAEYQEKVFGLFEQLDPGSGGGGIGLAIVRRIVEEHCGRIWVESAGCGLGSTFYFTLPI
ncbi:MAG: PAS domain S-box protein [Desulfuromonadales bacterium]|nr:PAS domain S-box protein [Desulfuromonadales bacterium]